MAPREKTRQRPTLPQSLPCSTIGPGGLYFRVRDGNGCYPSGIAARKKVRSAKTVCGEPLRSSSGILSSEGHHPCAHETSSLVGIREKKVVKPHDQLVPVSSTHYCASTPGLSTTWSSWGLQEAEASGTPGLEEGFPLRCFQRLSLPDIATRRCGWRHNRYTIGPSNPVLSY